MPNKVIVQNLYRTTITSATPIPASGDFSFDVAVAPTRSNGFLIIGSENASTRQIVYYHDVIGVTIYVRGTNRISAAEIALPTGYSVKMNDVAEIFNYYGDNISTLFYVEKMGGLSAKVWGGYIMYNNAQVLVADTTLSLTDNTTNYVKYDQVTNIVSVDTVASGNIKCEIVCISGEIASILYRVSKESYLDFTISLTGALPAQAGNSRKMLQTNGSVVTWGEKDDYVVDTGAANAYLASVPLLTAYAAGVNFAFKATNANTGASTINVSGLGVKNIVKQGNIPLVTGDILAGQIIPVIYDGTNFQITGGTPTAPSTVEIQETQYESTIVAGDLVGQLPDGIFEIKSEVFASTALGGANTYLGQCLVSPGVYCVMYIVGGVAYGVIATLNPTTDAFTYGTPVNLGALAAGTGGVALVAANKLVFVYTSSASSTTHAVVSLIGTVSGTSISVGTTLTTNHNSGVATSASIGSVFKVRSDAYGYVIIQGSNQGNFAQVNTCPSTTPVLGTTIATYGSGGTCYGSDVTACYLADNYIAVAENGSTSGQTKGYIYQINAASTAIVTTYGNVNIIAGNVATYLARYSATEFVVTNGSTSAMTIYTIPGAGTTLVATSLTANAGASYPVIALFDGIYAVHTGTTIVVRQRDVIIGTITGVTALAALTDGENIMYTRGRIVYFTGATLIPQIVNLARIFAIGVATNATGKFIASRNIASKTGVLKGYRQYLQSDGTLSDGTNNATVKTQNNYYGRGVLNNTIMIEV